MYQVLKTEPLHADKSRLRAAEERRCTEAD